MGTDVARLQEADRIRRLNKSGLPALVFSEDRRFNKLPYRTEEFNCWKPSIRTLIARRPNSRRLTVAIEDHETGQLFRSMGFKRNRHVSKGPNFAVLLRGQSKIDRNRQWPLIFGIRLIYVGSVHSNYLSARCPC
jgi:hypothetical protein